MIKSPRGFNDKRSLSALRQITERERAIVRLPNGLAAAATLWELYKSGVVAVPVSPRVDAAYLAFVSKHSGASWIVDRSGVARVRESDARGALDDLVSSDDRFLMYTSGSTGGPKGVVLGREAVEHNARTVAVRARCSVFRSIWSAPCARLWLNRSRQFQLSLPSHERCTVPK